MANIFIAMYNMAMTQHRKDRNIMPPYYEALLKGLKKAGNNVLCFHYEDCWFDFKNKSIDKSLLKKIKEFNPDLCIFFNNGFWDITNIFDCPILIWDVDSPSLYPNKNGIEQNPDRYKFVTLQASAKKIIKAIFNIKDKNIELLSPFTEIHADKNIPAKYNIVFCGINWLIDGGFYFLNGFLNLKDITFEEKIAAKEVLSEYITYPFKTSEQIYKEKGFSCSHRIKWPKHLVDNQISGLKRLRFLTEIADLGLEIRGMRFFEKNMNYFPELMFCFNPEPTFSLLENENLYNQAKIGFNTNHIQAVSGFSWRVCDIMASNACLVSEYKPDMDILFPGIELPTFTNKFEARTQCNNILNNDNLRIDIMSQCHEIINRKFRFEHTLEKLENFLKIELHTEEEGTLEFLHCNIEKYKMELKPFFKDLVDKMHYTIWSYIYRS